MTIETTYEEAMAEIAAALGWADADPFEEEHEMTKAEKRVAEISKASGIPAEQIRRGLDDGTWVLCGRCSYPVATVDLIETSDGEEELCEGCYEDYEDASYSAANDALAGW